MSHKMRHKSVTCDSSESDWKVLNLWLKAFHWLLPQFTISLLLNTMWCYFSHKQIAFITKHQKKKKTFLHDKRQPHVRLKQVSSKPCLWLSRLPLNITRRTFNRALCKRHESKVCLKGGALYITHVQNIQSKHCYLRRMMRQKDSTATWTLLKNKKTTRSPGKTCSPTSN